jgi:hypothetical protein
MDATGSHSGTVGSSSMWRRATASIGSVPRLRPAAHVLLHATLLQRFTGMMNEAEYEAAGLVETWAEAVLRQVGSYRNAWSLLNQAWDHFDRADNGWSPAADERSRAFRTLWAEAHLLVWSARQLEVWVVRLAKERAELAPAEDPWLKTLRDALEHLNEAKFRNGQAVPGRLALDTVAAGRKWTKPLWKALLALPERSLETCVVDDGRLFGLVEPERLEKAAYEALERIESERLDYAAEMWIESQQQR